MESSALARKTLKLLLCTKQLCLGVLEGLGLLGGSLDGLLDVAGVLDVVAERPLLRLACEELVEIHLVGRLDVLASHGADLESRVCERLGDVGLGEEGVGGIGRGH